MYDFTFLSVNLIFQSMLSSDSVSMCPGRPAMLCDHFKTCCFVSFNRFALIMLDTDWESVVDKS